MKLSKWVMAAGAVGLLTIGAVIPAAAQARVKRPNAAVAPMMRQPLLGRMALILAKLNLTPAQKKQVRGFAQDAQVKAKAVRADTTLTPQERRAKMREIVKGLRESITGILTPEQKAKARKLMAAGPAQRPILVRLVAILGRLDLSPDQKKQVKGLISDARAKAKIVRESKLPPAQKRLKIQAIEKVARESIVGILTPEQKAKLRDLLKQMPPAPPAPK